MIRPILFVLSMTLVMPAANGQGHKEDGDIHHDSLIHLGPVQVLGDFNRSDILNTVPTVSTLHGDDLLKTNVQSLGEALSREVGVNSTQFGWAASRPVIRGLGGDRIRVLQNGIGLLDASGASQDHAVTTNILTAESVEVVRGPINLLYGSSAIGGVVNIVNSRIHTAPIEGFMGAADLRAESVNQGQNYAAKLDYGTNNFALHVDGQFIKTEDFDTPEGEVANSAIEQDSVAVGATYFDGHQNYFGLAYSSFKNFYGVVKEENAQIDLNQDRVELAGYYRTKGWVKAIRVKSAQTLYHHTELENGEAATRFENAGNETRVELIQNNQGKWSGIFGFQSQLIQFKALGEEAFLPSTDLRELALFGFEEYTSGKWKLSAGLRAETSLQKSDDEAFFAEEIERSFDNKSLAFGGLYQWSQKVSTGWNLSYNERAPSYQELFADGAHLAVGIYEQGDQQLENESSVGLEWSLRYQNLNNNFVMTMFQQSFDHFVALNPTGSFDDTDESGTAGDSDEDFEIYNYQQQKAEFRGFEIEWRRQWVAGWATRASFDYLYGKNRTTGQPLARVSPKRFGVGLGYRFDQLETELEWRYVAKQDRVAENETKTDAYSMLNWTSSYRVMTGESSALDIYVNIENITDVEARNHVSLLKDQVTLAGRNFVMGGRWMF